MEPLLQADQLVELLDRQDLVLIDVRYRLGSPGWGREQYLAGHLPGAVFVDVDEELSAPVAADRVGGRHPLPAHADFQASMRRCGVRTDSHVVVCDQANSLAAARLWWLLRHHGHERVQVLDGGVEAWRAAGGELTTELPAPETGDVVAQPGRLPLATADELPGLMEQGRHVVDVRAAERFRGESEPIDPVAGHIPGALNLPATTLQQSDGRFLPPGELRQRLEVLRPGDVTSCGSGLTASQVQLGAAAAGIGGLVLYAGSWSDWVSDPTRPVALGEQ
ncbi:sulfurtransferase [Luteococcus peritonei]|uniref:Sulfurtransferase n=1 Tax=Luteococcus peritonei TaxID=88874 RepID=A0ABW4RRY6_9ACTN